jgi:hypothetical protein
MQPGAWFTHGFLVMGTPLVDVLAEDAHTLIELRVTAEQIGCRLAELLQSAAKSDWFRPFRTGGYGVEIHRRRGLIACPWASDEFESCATGKGGHPTANQFVIRRKGTRQRLEGYELSVHLIRDHAFFGGPGSVFRVEPRQAVAVLGLLPP